MGLDPTMNLDNFGRPKVISETETLVNNILMILFGRPGFYPSIPDLGMDIGKYIYNFEEDVSTEEIKNALSLQCEEFSPSINAGDIDVMKVDTSQGQTGLLFILPVINDRKTSQISLAIIVDDDGKLMYNFKEDEIQEI